MLPALPIYLFQGNMMVRSSGIFGILRGPLILPAQNRANPARKIKMLTKTVLLKYVYVGFSKNT